MDYLFLCPDIAILGYGVIKKTGSMFYNIFHHKGLAIAMTATGLLADNNVLMLAGTIMFAHSSCDRILGYGLKYSDDFKHTPLGWIKYNL